MSLEHRATRPAVPLQQFVMRQLFCTMFVLIALATGQSDAQIREWILEDPTLAQRTTSLLDRYYSVTRPDSARLRYLRNTAPIQHYRLRGRLASPDSVTAIVSVTLGQLTIFPSDNVRIAIGDDLYSQLLSVGSHAGDGDISMVATQQFGSTRLSAAIDRVEWMVTDEMAIVGAVGTPESNLPWWTDGTARIGVAMSQWEFAALLPLAIGATPVGPLRERRLLPSYGATGRVSIDGFTAMVRLSRPLGFDASDSGRYYHSVGGTAGYGRTHAILAGLIAWRVGIGVEEFQPRTPDSIRADEIDIVRRVSPEVSIAWGDFRGIVHVGVATHDRALLAYSSLRLTSTLWLDIRVTGTEIFRKRDSFEHPVYVFLTPRIWF